MFNKFNGFHLALITLLAVFFVRKNAEQKKLVRISPRYNLRKSVSEGVDFGADIFYSLGLKKIAAIGYLIFAIGYVLHLLASPLSTLLTK